MQTGKLGGVFNDLPREFDLIVVEDTMGGIRSTLAAGETLMKNGFEIRARAIGLTGGNKSKAEAFSNAGVEYAVDWAELLGRNLI